MITRTAELKKLDDLYTKPSSQLVVVYGSKGCLKEEFLKTFSKGKPSFYFRSRNASSQQQLKLLSDDLNRAFGTKMVEDDYKSCFTKISKFVGGKTLIIIDEFQNIVKKDPAFINAIVQFKKSNDSVFIVLACSSLSWIGSELEKSFGEKYSSIDMIHKLDDVGFLDVVRAFPGYSVEQCVSVYGILGGVPEYLNRWNGKRDIRENICNLILNPNGFLFNEAENYISTELRELSVYDTILASIARGNEKLNDLFVDTGYSRAKISVYMKNLAAFDVVNKVVSFETGGWDNAKKGIYQIKRNYCNFWFHFIYPNLSDLYSMTPEQFYDKYIGPELDEYLQKYFSLVCREYLMLLNKVNQLPINITKMGVWLGKEGTIDIIGQDATRTNVVGICNWSNSKMTYDDYEKLLANMKLARISAKTVYLFSAKAFDQKLTQLAEINDQVVLVDMKEL